MPLNSHDAANRVANQLSEKLNSADSNRTCMVDDNHEEINYSLGKYYGGEERREVERPWSKR